MNVRFILFYPESSSVGFPPGLADADPRSEGQKTVVQARSKDKTVDFAGLLKREWDAGTTNVTSAHCKPELGAASRCLVRNDDRDSTCYIYKKSITSPVAEVWFERRPHR
jgi:hypothetical protein